MTAVNGAADACSAVFRPQSVAIIGASETGGEGFSARIFENLRDCNFPAKVHLVNPRRSTLWGQPVFHSLADIPGPVDLALALVPAPAIVPTLEEGLACGLKSAIVMAARFGEGQDPEGAARAAELKSLVARGLRIVGPNCLGAISLREQLFLYPSTDLRRLRSGGVGVVFQSGGLFRYWMLQASARGLGFSYAVSSGNELDLDMAHFINFMVDDPDTSQIVCLIEGVTRPQAFMAAAARALAANKPLIVLKTGRTEASRASAASHIGAISGDDAVFDAFCRSYGVVRCDSLDDLIETALCFQQGRVPTGRGVTVVGFSGASRSLFLDHGDAIGVQFAALGKETLATIEALIDPGIAPYNPVDTGPGLAVRQEDYVKLCIALAADPATDVLLMQGRLPDVDMIEPPAISAVVASTGKPVLAYDRTSSNVSEAGLRAQAASGTVFLQRIPDALRAVRALVDYAADRSAPPPELLVEPVHTDHTGIKELLAAAGVAMPTERRVADAAEAAVAAVEIGFPVAVKLHSEDTLHKTELGGVALGLKSAEEVSSACDAMAQRLRSASGGTAEVEGFLVQEMISGAELIVGARTDPQFGPVIVAGLGGTTVEVIGDVSVRLLPIGRDTALAMLDELKTRRLLDAFRGRAARDVNAVADIIVAVGNVFLENRMRCTDIEINPLIVLAEGHGARAVDVRVVFAEPGGT